MITSIQKWGNSQAVRIPKNILDGLQLTENTRVRIQAEDGRIVITPEDRFKPLTDRVAEYEASYEVQSKKTDKPYVSHEWDTGKPQGKEVW